MLLPDEFIERARPHPHRQRRDAVQVLLARVGEKVHSVNCTPFLAVIGCSIRNNPLLRLPVATQTGRMKSSLRIACVLTLLLAASALGDEVLFKNGDKLTGKITSVEGGKL